MSRKWGRGVAAALMLGMAPEAAIAADCVMRDQRSQNQGWIAEIVLRPRSRERLQKRVSLTDRVSQQMPDRNVVVTIELSYSDGIDEGGRHRARTGIVWESFNGGPGGQRTSDIGLTGGEFRMGGRLVASFKEGYVGSGFPAPDSDYLDNFVGDLASVRALGAALTSGQAVDFSIQRRDGGAPLQFQGLRFPYYAQSIARAKAAFGQVNADHSAGRCQPRVYVPRL